MELLNGNGPLPPWLKNAINALVYVLEKGVAFQIVAIVLMVVIGLAYFGKIENPQMTALIRAVEGFSHQHSQQIADHTEIKQAVDRAVHYLDRNQGHIRENNHVGKEGFKEVVRGLEKLCWINAETKEERQVCAKD